MRTWIMMGWLLGVALGSGGCSNCGGLTFPRPFINPPRPEWIASDHLTGSFASTAQAESDPENYFDIRLESVWIWRDRGPGAWLYIEQAAASALDRPYRQRIYNIRPIYEPVVTPWGEATVISDVYEFDEPLRFAGKWREPEAFDALTLDDLTRREGCSVYLVRKFESGEKNDPNEPLFIGGTIGTGCSSSLAGATYATSEVWIYADRLETWDRGFDAEGNQVWGATEGPYVFVRMDDDASRD